MAQLETFYPGPHYLPVHLLLTFRYICVTPRSDISQCQQQTCRAVSRLQKYTRSLLQQAGHARGEMLCLSSGLEASYNALTCLF